MPRSRRYSNDSSKSDSSATTDIIYEESKNSMKSNPNIFDNDHDEDNPIEDETILQYPFRKRTIANTRDEKFGHRGKGSS